MNKRKINARYFGEEYWTSGTISAYAPQLGYTEDDFQWEAIAKMLVELFGKNKKYLEAGCAYGWIVNELVKLGVDAYGFDISKYTIKRRPEAVKDRVFRSDGMKLKFPDGEFGVVYTLETAEHIHPDDVLVWWGELSRVLKPSGYVFAAICLGNNNRRGVDDLDESHQTLQPREWWYKTLSKVELERHELLEEKIYSVKVYVDKMLEHEPINLAEYYHWGALGLQKC